jgi:hypothetical protein
LWPTTAPILSLETSNNCFADSSNVDQIRSALNINLVLVLSLRGGSGGGTGDERPEVVVVGGVIADNEDEEGFPLDGRGGFSLYAGGGIGLGLRDATGDFPFPLGIDAKFEFSLVESLGFPPIALRIIPSTMDTVLDET